MDKICAGIRIDAPRVQAFAGYMSDQDKIFLQGGKPLSGGGSFEFHIKAPRLGMGTYFVSIALYKFEPIVGDHSTLFAVDRALSFEMKREHDLPLTYACELDTSFSEFAAETQSCLTTS